MTLKRTLEEVLHDKKNLFLNQPKPYQNELLMLEKTIKFNRDKNNTYAVLRDEVLTKSYHILQAQNRMSRHILRSLDLYNFQEFNKDMNDRFIENQLAIRKN